MDRKCGSGHSVVAGFCKESNAVRGAINSSKYFEEHRRA